MTLADTHRCVDLKEIVDALGTTFGVTCRCGWAAMYQPTAAIAAATYGDHLVLLAFDLGVATMKGADNAAPDPNHGPVHRGWPARLRAHLAWPVAAPPGTPRRAQHSPADHRVTL